jgi:hypothetical protein
MMIADLASQDMSSISCGTFKMQLVYMQALSVASIKTNVATGKSVIMK